MTESWADLNGRTVLVTGASGFIGAHLCERLVRAGATIHAVSRVPRSQTTDLRWWQGDLADSETVRRLVSAVRPDSIIHLASYVSGARDLNAVLPTLHANGVAAVNLLVAATESGCRRMVLAGSLEEPAPDEPVGIPGSPYAAAKLAASAYARMFHSLYRTPVTIARLFMVYGPAQPDLRKLVPYVSLSLLRGETPRLSSGVRPVDWIYVDDIVEGLIAAVRAPELEGESIDLGSGQLVTIHEVVRRIYAILSPDIEPPFGTLPDRPMEQVRSANLALTTAKTGWRPAIGLDEGLRRTIDWYARALREGIITWPI